MSRVKTVLVLLVFLANALFPANGAWAQSGSLAALNLPVLGTMVRPGPAYRPVLACGMAVDQDHPLQFSFIIDKGDSGLPFEGDAFRQESTKLVKYFLAALTVPEKEQWVNLSPYEKDRITGEGLGRTEMGRDMLAQDYILKQLAASLVYPEDKLGQEFWQRVYRQVKDRFGVTEVPLDTFNKVWIVPDRGVVYEQGNKVFVIEQHLKVMLEQDYLALQKAQENSSREVPAGARDRVVSAAMSDIVRDVLVPAIEKEVNTGRNFASLRQIYNSMILAVWYKKTLRDSFLGRTYVDRGKTAGVRVDDPDVRQQIYEQYLASFKAGVYNYIKEEADPVTGETVPKKYVSGGAAGFPGHRLRTATAEEARPWVAARTPEGTAEVVVDLAEVAEAFGDGIGGGRKMLSQPIKAGMAFIFGTGNNGAVVGEDGKIETDGGALLELGQNIIFRASLNEWVFTGKETRGNKPVKEPADYTFESLFSGVGIARQMWSENALRQSLLGRMETEFREEEITAYLNMSKSDISEDDKRRRALLVDMVLRAGTARAASNDAVVESFIRRLGEKIGMALAAMFVVYKDASWVKNFIMVSGVGEHFARASDPEKDLLVNGIRDGVREALARNGVSADLVEEIARGIRRSDISWEREIIAARLTAEEITQIKDKEGSEDEPYIAVGVSIGGTKIGAGQISLDGRIMTDEPVEVKWREAYPESPDGVTRGIVDQVKRSLEGADLILVRKIGIAFAGPVDRERGIVGTPFKAPNLPFEKYSLAVQVKSAMETWIRAQTGVTVDLIVDVYNDAYAAVLGEARSPAGLLQGDSSQKIEKTGGIDLDAALMDFQVRRDSQGKPLSLPSQVLSDSPISGLEPQIRKIVPVSIPALLERGATARP